MKHKRKLRSKKQFPTKVSAIGLRKGFRSGLEEANVAHLHKNKVSFRYEPFKIPYVQPVSQHVYTPDFVLGNNIIVETKGHLTSDDRKKHLLIKEQYPDIDIRFVFSNANNKLYKSSSTTYAKWAEKHGFIYASRTIPIDWAKEPRKVLPDFIESKGSKSSSNG